LCLGWPKDTEVGSAFHSIERRSASNGENSFTCASVTPQRTGMISA